MKKYSINESKLPKILITDPVSKYFGMKRGDVFKIHHRYNLLRNLDHNF